MSEDAKFEVLLGELERIVQKLQQPDLPLDEAVALYKRGTEVAEKSEVLLSAAEVQVQKLTDAVQERFAEYAVEEMLEDEE